MRTKRGAFPVALVIVMMLCACSALSHDSGARESEKTMSEPVRVDPDVAYQAIKAGKALFVCAYKDEERCRKNHLEGAIFLQEFEARLPSLPKNQQIIFYCA